MTYTTENLKDILNRYVPFAHKDGFDSFAIFLFDTVRKEAPYLLGLNDHIAGVQIITYVLRAMFSKFTAHETFEYNHDTDEISDIPTSVEMDKPKITEIVDWYIYFLKENVLYLPSPFREEIIERIKNNIAKFEYIQRPDKKEDKKK